MRKKLRRYPLGITQESNRPRAGIETPVKKASGAPFIDPGRRMQRTNEDVEFAKYFKVPPIEKRVVQQLALKVQECCNFLMRPAFCENPQCFTYIPIILVGQSP